MQYSNETGSLKLIEEINIPFVENERKRLPLPNQEVLLIMDVFKGQMIVVVLNKLKNTTFSWQELLQIWVIYSSRLT